MFNYDTELKLREQQRQAWLKQVETERHFHAEIPPQKSLYDSALETIGDLLITSGTYLKERQQLNIGGENYGRADV